MPTKDGETVESNSVVEQLIVSRFGRALRMARSAWVDAEIPTIVEGDKSAPALAIIAVKIYDDLKETEES